MIRTALMLTVLAALAGCVGPSLAPGASTVVVTRDPLVVRSCHALGTVSVPYGSEKLAKNAGVAMDADTVLITTSKWAEIGTIYAPPPPSQGIAYRCAKASG